MTAKYIINALVISGSCHAESDLSTGLGEPDVREMCLLSDLSKGLLRLPVDLPLSTIKVVRLPLFGTCFHILTLNYHSFKIKYI